MEWVCNRSDELAVQQGCRFDVAAAERVREFFGRFIRHSKGRWAGKPFELLQWQWEGVVAPFFGWKRPDGTRRFRRAYIEVPKKNGKSTLLAALALYLLMADNEPGAEVYCAAVDREQASIIFNESCAMVDASRDLSKYLRPNRSSRRISFPAGNGFLRALSADAPNKEGLNASAILFDELHAQRNWELWNTLRYAGAARVQPVWFSITTAGYDRSSLCWEQRTRALAVRDGTSDDVATLAYVAGAAEDDDWRDPAVWRRANPSFGVTLSETDFAEDFADACKTPVGELTFRRYRLNQWVKQAEKWMDVERWDACVGPLTPLTDGDCIVGLDLAATTDIAAAVALKLGDKPEVHPAFWCSAYAAQNRRRDSRQDIEPWVRAGFIHPSGDETIDYGDIDAWISGIAEGGCRVREIAIDPWNATHFAKQMEGHGTKVFFVRQNHASLSPAMKQVEKWLLDRGIVHGNDPVMRWMFGNLSIKQDPAGNIKPDKGRSVDKIDGITALMNAVARYVVMPQFRSIYETRGLMRLGGEHGSNKERSEVAGT